MQAHTTRQADREDRDVAQIGAAINAAMDGLDDAVRLLPPWERIWRGRFLRCRFVIAREAGYQPFEMVGAGWHH